MQLSLPLNTLPARDPVAEAEPETIEIQQLLMAAGEQRAACSDKVIQSVAGASHSWLVNFSLSLSAMHQQGRAWQLQALQQPVGLGRGIAAVHAAAAAAMDE